MTHWATAESMDETVIPRLRMTSTMHALPGYDEYLLGYRDRSAAMPAEVVDRVITGRNGIFHPTMLALGRVIGTWRSERADGATTTIEPFSERQAVDGLAFERSTAAFERFRSFWRPAVTGALRTRVARRAD